MADQIGITGKARFLGVVEASVQWTDSSSTARTLAINSEVSKTMMADISDGKDREGEVQTRARRNKRIQLRFSATPVGSSATDARDIGANLPHAGDTCTITCTNDSQVATPSGGTSIVDDATARYTAEGELVVDFTVTNWIGKAFIALS